MPNFDMMDLIAAPIIAMNEAEADNASRFVELVNEFAFDENEATKEKSLRKLEFTFDRIDPDGQPRVHSVAIPMIQFMPIGGVAIDQATLNYALKMQPESAEDHGRLRMTGQMAESQDKENGLSGNVNIEIKLKQIDLPQGVLSMLETAQAGIVHRDATLPKPEPELDPTFPTDNGKLLDVNRLDKGPAYIEAGKKYTSQFDVRVSEAVRAEGVKVEIALSSWPKSALIFENQDNFVLSDKKEVSLSYSVSPEIERYAEQTKIKLIMNAKVIKADDSIIGQKLAFDLPRKFQS